MTSGKTGTITHGSSCLKRGCHCLLAKAYNREKQRRATARRAERLKADPTLAPHGNVQTYENWGCRCESCREAKKVKNRENYERRNGLR